jgi:hypothetical protein
MTLTIKNRKTGYNKRGCCTTQYSQNFDDKDKSIKMQNIDYQILKSAIKMSCATSTNAIANAGCVFVETFEIFIYICVGLKMQCNLVPHLP